MIEVFNSHVDRLALWLQIHSYSGIFLYTSQDIQYLVFWVTTALGNFLDKLNILIEWKKISSQKHFMIAWTIFEALKCICLYNFHGIVGQERKQMKSIPVSYLKNTRNYKSNKIWITLNPKSSDIAFCKISFLHSNDGSWQKMYWNTGAMMRAT